MYAATDSFDTWLRGQITSRKQLWLDAFFLKMDNLSLSPRTTSASALIAACDAASAILKSDMQRFSEDRRPLRPGSLADLSLQNLQAEITDEGARNKKNKLTQFDELSSLYNRGLLSKTVTPVVEKVRFASARM